MSGSNGGPRPDMTSFAELAPYIYPMLKPLQLLVLIREQQLPMIVYRLFLADLMVTYVIDQGDRVAYITEDHLAHWGIGEHVLHERALANLRARTMEHSRYTAAGEGASQLFIYATQDGYDATRLLLTDVLAAWAQQLPGRLLIAIPNRDFLIAFSDANPEVVQSVAYQVQLDAAQREHGLTDQLFIFQGGTVREYEWT